MKIEALIVTYIEIEAYLFAMPKLMLWYVFHFMSPIINLVGAQGI